MPHAPGCTWSTTLHSPGPTLGCEPGSKHVNSPMPLSPCTSGPSVWNILPIFLHLAKHDSSFSDVTSCRKPSPPLWDEEGVPLLCSHLTLDMQLLEHSSHLVIHTLVKESACNLGDLGLIPGLGRCPGEEKSHPLQYSGLENSMDCIVHGVAKSWI